MTTFPLLDRLPSEDAGPGQMPKLRALADDLDTLVVRDPQDGRLLVQRSSLSRVLERHFEPGTGHALLARFEQGFGGYLTDQQGWPRVDWEQLPRHGAPVHPPSAADLDATGLPLHPQPGQVGHWIHQNYPELEAAAARLTREQLSGLARQISPASQSGEIAAAGSVAGFENCLVRHLGLWGMIALVAALGAVIIVLTATGPFAVPLIEWLIGTFGTGTAFIIISCAVNNSW